ncbi:MAG TPA: FAD-dependent oxidoreductase [Jiangellaceae bacterium]|nr:FAD-dependent oxidoreductase [Jiangellaceae bacterium]
MPTTAPFVIVGASLAGAKTAEALRDQGHDGAIVLVGDETERPYERPPLSKDYLTGKADRDTVYVHPPSWYDEHDVELRLGTTVTAVQPGSYRVVLDDGETLGYAKLLIATGSTPRPLPVPGGNLDGVLYLRRLADSDRIRQTLHEGSRLVVVGAGWIGLETAAAARAAGADVTVLERSELPLLRVLGAEMAQVFADLHRDHGVDLRLGVTVAEIAGHDGKASAVVLADGTRLPADAVIAGVGITPVTGLAEAAGLDVDNGILVDEHLRTSDPDIYAAGDVANAFHPRLGRRLRVEHWANALHQPAVAATGMLGGQATYDRTPYFYTDQYDLGMEYTGFAETGDYDQIVVRGDTARREFVAFWLRDRRVLAGMNVNVRDVIDRIEELIRSGTPVDAAQLADSDTPLVDLVEH